MATIESAVRVMLQGSPLNSIPNSRITHGFRLQSSSLPAVTFEVNRDEILSIGSGELHSAEVEIRVIAATSAAALAFASNVRQCCVAGTYDGIVFQSVVWGGRQLDQDTVGEGDESEPAELVCFVTITYTE